MKRNHGYSDRPTSPGAGVRGHVARVVAASALAACALVSGSALAAPVLYGITFGEQLITINTTTGAGTLVGPLSSDMNGFGLAVTAGKLYTYDQSADLLRELNPATGATVSSVDLGLGDRVGEGGLDFRSDGKGFMAQSAGASSTIYSFTTSASSGVTVGSNSTAGIDGLAFDSGDVLFALGQQDDNDLYTVDQSTGALTLIGATGVDGSNSLGGLDFLGSKLYAVINDSLYTIDTATGTASLIGATGFTQVSGIAFLEVNGTPEPGSLGLLGLGLGLAGLAGSRRRKQ